MRFDVMAVGARLAGALGAAYWATIPTKSDTDEGAAQELNARRKYLGATGAAALLLKDSLPDKWMRDTAGAFGAGALTLYFVNTVGQGRAEDAAAKRPSSGFFGELWNGMRQDLQFGK